MTPSDIKRDLIENAARFWLMKTEPRECSICDVLNAPGHKMSWFGIRNYQARNFMRDDMRVGDAVLFYHSSCKNPGIVGLARIASEVYPDECQFDDKSEYFDPKSTKENPRWLALDVEALETCPTIGIKTLREHEALSSLLILRKGNRLSITPVEKADFIYIVRHLMP